MTPDNAEVRPERSLYPLLSQMAPDGPGPETMITATKETIDNDSEDVADDDILQL